MCKTKMTQGLLNYIFEQHKVNTIAPTISVKALAAYEKMCEDVFTYVDTSRSKLVQCARCGDVIVCTKGNDCECGYIQELVTYLTEHKDNT